MPPANSAADKIATRRRATINTLRSSAFSRGASDDAQAKRARDPPNEPLRDEPEKDRAEQEPNQTGDPGIVDLPGEPLSEPVEPAADNRNATLPLGKAFLKRSGKRTIR